MAHEYIMVTVKPRATRAGVELTPEGGVIVRVHAPAAEGAANKELIATFADAVGVPKTTVHIIRGEKSRTKQLAVDNVSVREVRARLAHKVHHE